MLNSWNKSTLPMPKRMQDLDLSIEFLQQVESASKSVKTHTFGSKILQKPMRTAEILKLFDFEPSPVVTKARRQLWSAQNSGSKKRNEQIKITATKENVRRSKFPKTSSTRISTVKTNPADQTLPLIDMEDLEKNPRKIKQSLRIPQSTADIQTTTNPNAKRQTMFQTKLVKPVVKPATGTKSNSLSTVNNPPKTVGEGKLKRQTVQQTRYALKSIPEISITECKDSKEKGLSETVHENERESVYDILKQILGRMDRLETLIEKNRCTECHPVVDPCKHQKTKETHQENVQSLEHNTDDFTENVPVCNDNIVENIVTNRTTESIQQTTDSVTEKVIDHAASEVIENIENVTQIANKVPENPVRNTKYDNKNCVQNLFPIFTCNAEEISMNENPIKPTELMEGNDTDVCTNFTLINATSENTLHKSHFELLEDELQNDSLTSLAFIDSDDSASPVFQEFNYDYLLGGKDDVVREINTLNGATTDSAKELRGSTGSNDAIRTYNEMRKCIPMLCTPKISKNNNASLMTPSVQNSHKKLLSRRIQEQLLMLNK